MRLERSTDIFFAWCLPKFTHIKNPNYQFVYKSSIDMLFGVCVVYFNGSNHAFRPEVEDAET